MDRATIRESILRQSYVFNTGSIALTQAQQTSTAPLFRLRSSTTHSLMVTTCVSNTSPTKITNPKLAQLQED